MLVDQVLMLLKSDHDYNHLQNGWHVGHLRDVGERSRAD